MPRVVVSARARDCDCVVERLLGVPQEPAEEERRQREAAANSEAAFKRWKAEKDKERKEAKVHSNDCLLLLVERGAQVLQIYVLVVA